MRLVCCFVMGNIFPDVKYFSAYLSVFFWGGRRFYLFCFQILCHVFDRVARAFLFIGFWVGGMGVMLEPFVWAML